MLAMHDLCVCKIKVWISVFGWFIGSVRYILDHCLKAVPITLLVLYWHKTLMGWSYLLSYDYILVYNNNNNT